MNEYKAGILTEKNPGKGYTFCYDEDYLLSDHPAVSVTLPKRKEPFEDDHMFPFFTNMVPEGANRKVICRALRIDENDFFGLLTAMADKDFIGAVQIKKLTDD
jgi:serine/threonine-protein kinase HipA